MDRCVVTLYNKELVSLHITICNNIATTFSEDSSYLSTHSSKDKHCPWASHFSGYLCFDSPDTLALENGARRNWLYSQIRGNINMSEMHESDDLNDQDSLKKPGISECMARVNLVRTLMDKPIHVSLR